MCVFYIQKHNIAFYHTEQIESLSVNSVLSIAKVITIYIYIHTSCELAQTVTAHICVQTLAKWFTVSLCAVSAVVVANDDTHNTAQLRMVKFCCKIHTAHYTI